MGVRPRDTHPAVWARLERRIQAMTPCERVQRAAALTVLAHRFALAELRRQYPRATERELQLRLAARSIPPPLMKAAFDWPPDDPMDDVDPECRPAPSEGKTPAERR